MTRAAERDAYVAAARAAIDAGPDRDPSIAPWLTPACVECDTLPPDGHPDHVMHRGYVLVGCEGYWQVDPNRLGIPNERWCDWRTP